MEASGSAKNRRVTEATTVRVGRDRRCPLGLGRHRCSSGGNLRDARPRRREARAEPGVTDVLLRHRHPGHCVRRDPPFPVILQLALIPPSCQFTASISFGDFVYRAATQGSEDLAERVRGLLTYSTTVLPFALSTKTPVALRPPTGFARLGRPPVAQPDSGSPQPFPPSSSPAIPAGSNVSKTSRSGIGWIRVRRAHRNSSFEDHPVRDTMIESNTAAMSPIRPLSYRIL